MHLQFSNIIQYNDQIAPRLNDLNKPLADNFSFYFLAYRRFYNEGNLLYLFNNAKWKEFCFQNASWHSNSFWQKVEKIADSNCLIDIWPELPHNDKVFSSMYSFDIWNGLVYYLKNDDYIETFSFASTRENPQVKHFYMNNNNLLNTYITYFKSKGHDLINPNDKDIFIPCPCREQQDSAVTFDGTASFLNQTQLKTYSITIGLRDVLLTKREMDCIYCLARGMTIKEAARTLELSPRTVESYLNLAKEKAGVQHTSDLIQAFLKNQHIMASYHI